jgi:hypothetical protein
MDDQPSPQPAVIHYFIDEAGDSRLFKRRRKLAMGQEGVSNYFALGKLEIDDPTKLCDEFNALRAKILTDPYFRKVPSLRLERGRTAIMFHACKDLPEVRYLVFKLLARQAVSFYAVIRDKRRVADEVLAKNRANRGYWFKETDLYDELVKNLFETSFHHGGHYEICFAKRGKSDRTEALYLALDQARQKYESNLQVRCNTTINIQARLSKERAGLQAADYFLWALQRLYEKNEDRFWASIEAKVKWIYDRDDTREKPFGKYYTPQNPLTLENRAKK